MTTRSGMRYGMLLVLHQLHPIKASSKWVCQCDCGNQITVYSRELRGGTVKSCGCGPKGRPRYGHEMVGTRVYRVWRQMRQRCNNPKAEGYENYGGRGIRVSQEWETSFEQFYTDMGDPPEDTTIDREDTNGPYSAENCKWSTWREQHRNRRDNNLITAFGKTQCLTAWAEEYKLPVSTLKNRIFRAKMTPEDALKAKIYAQQRKKSKL